MLFSVFYGAVQINSKNQSKWCEISILITMDCQNSKLLWVNSMGQLQGILKMKYSKYFCHRLWVILGKRHFKIAEPSLPLLETLIRITWQTLVMQHKVLLMIQETTLPKSLAFYYAHRVLFRSKFDRH